MDVTGITAIVSLGLVLGSFATALAYRLPRDLSIVKIKRSQCPACHKDLGMADLVPVFSWIFLKGRCRHCKEAIGWQYPLIELATVALCLIFYSAYGFRPETFLIFVLAPVIISLIDIDLRYKIIPDGLNLTVFLTGLMVLCINAAMAASPISFIIEKGGAAAAGALLYGLGSLTVRQVALLVMKREAMGLGDIKFFAAAGFWMGLDADKASLFMVVSGISGTAMAIIWKRYRGEAEFPFGPALIVGFIATLWLYPPVFVDL